MLYDHILVRVMTCFYGRLYEGRDTVVCYSYKNNETPDESSVSRYI
jgi:hypothetical protein